MKRCQFGMKMYVIFFLLWLQGDCRLQAFLSVEVHNGDVQKGLKDENTPLGQLISLSYSAKLCFPAFPASPRSYQLPPSACELLLAYG